MYLLCKRILDLFLATIAIVLLLPLFLVLMILLRITDEGEVFYPQQRIGFNGQYFSIFKFATMLKNSLNMGSGSITLRNDARVTTMGRFLRKSKLNELPQLFNVLIGNMSFVGPRPLVDKTFNAYSDDIKMIVCKVKPGITGVGSIVFRDEEKLISNAKQSPHEFYQNTIAPYKGELERWYVANKSFWLDLKLLFLTLWHVIFSNSDLIFKVFTDLPGRPLELDNLMKTSINS